MKKIIVAGAGHGGLVAAKCLAENGFDVTVIEKKPREELGYDWHDCIWLPIYEHCGIDEPETKDMLPFGDIAYFSPSKRIKMVRSNGISKTQKMAERKHVVNHLIDSAMNSGAKFIFGTGVSAPIDGGDRIAGVITDNGEKIEADMVIDSAGLNSPVRRKLPEKFDIINEIDEKDIFTVYRAYYSKTEEKISEPRYSIYFDHCNKRGMDWVITEDDFIDVLIGAFGRLTQKNIDDALDDFAKIYPYMSKEKIRGGSVEEIPLRRTLPIIVCSGYAAIGDSASMTEPLSGSGIHRSMTAGKMLADCLIASGGDVMLPALWKFQYRYFKKETEKMMNDDIIKNALGSLTPDELDYLFDKQVLTAKEIVGKSGSKYSAKEIILKANILGRPSIVKKLIKPVKSLMNMKKVFEMMPESYDGAEVTAWKKAYEKL